MTVGFVGADPDQLDALGLSLEDSSGRFAELRSTLGMGLYGGGWSGPDADSARSDWELLHGPALAAAADALVVIGALARSNATAQRLASAGDLDYQAGGGGDPTWPPPEYPGDGDPAALQQYWLNIALGNAGIDMATWDPSLGALANSQNINAVYTYYANLYLEHPYLLWAGMAAMVGPSFAAGFYDLPRFREIAEYSALQFHDVAFVGGFFESMASASAEDLAFYETTFLQMQQDIFVDQAVMHEAYLSGGMPAIQDLYDAGIIDDATLTAWQQIDDGIATDDMELIETGNTQLLYREQHDIIQPYYDAMFNRPGTGQAFTYFLGIVGDPAVPTAMTYGDFNPLYVTSEILTDVDIPILQEPPIPDVTVQTPFPDGNLANFDDRWEYISGDTLPAFQLLVEQSPEVVTEILTTPVDVRIEQYGINNRYEGIISDIQNDWGFGVTIEDQ